MSEPITVDDSYAQRFAELAAAREAAAKATAYYDGLKAALLADMGYDPGDERPQPCTAVDADGRPLFVVDVGYRKGFDKKGLAAKYPAVFAEFETKTPVRSVKAAE